MNNNLNGAKQNHTFAERHLKSGEDGDCKEDRFSRPNREESENLAGTGVGSPACATSDSSLLTREVGSPREKSLAPSSNNIQIAVYEFIAAYTNIEKNNIIKGWQSTSILPADSESYAVFTVINERRRGTNVEEYDPANEKVTVTKSNIIDIQIDIVAKTNMQARENAAMLETMARSSYGVDFFNKYSIGLLYADDARAIETISKTDNFVNRYMLMLHVEEINAVTVSQEYFDKVEVNSELANKKIDNNDK